MGQQILETAKYWNESVKAENRKVRKYASRKAVGDFSVFLFGLVVIGLVVLFFRPELFPNAGFADWASNVSAAVHESFLQLNRWIYS